MPEFDTSYAPDTGLALIFAESADRAQPFIEAVTASGGRIGGVLGLNEIESRLFQQSTTRAILVDFASPAVPGLGQMVSRVEQFAERVEASVVFAFPSEALDHVVAASRSDRATLLCDADPAERMLAVSLAWADRDLRLSDSAADIDTIRLKRLADEVHRIAKALNGLSSMADENPIVARAGSSSHVSDILPGFAAQPGDLIGFGAPDADDVRNVLRIRRLRDRFFDSELFADPAWDILLDLLAARLEGDQVAVSSLCIAAAVPPTTALRWIKTMTDTGLLERHADPMDGRRIFIRLTEKAADAMSRYFTAARRMGGMMI